VLSGGPGMVTAAKADPSALLATVAIPAGPHGPQYPEIQALVGAGAATGAATLMPVGLAAGAVPSGEVGSAQSAPPLKVRSTTKGSLPAASPYW